MKPLKLSLKKITRQKQNTNISRSNKVMRQSIETLDGWKNDSINALTQQIDRFNILSSRDNKIVNKNRVFRNKQQHYYHQKTQFSGIENLKQQALILDNDDFGKSINNLKEGRAITEPKSKSMESNKKHLENLFRLTKNGIISEGFEMKKQRALRKRTLGKTNYNQKGEGSVKKVRDTLMKEWEHAKKCISAVSSTKSSHKTYLNYSQRIKNATFYKKGNMRIVDEPIYYPPRLSVCSISQNNKLQLINTILKERFPEIF